MRDMWGQTGFLYWAASVTGVALWLAWLFTGLEWLADKALRWWTRRQQRQADRW